MQGASLQSYDFTITAGQTMPLLASGNYFLIKSSTGALDVRGEFGQAKAMIAGQGLSGRDFTKLELKNNTGATITGLILIEDGAENGNGFFDLNLILSGSLIVRPEAATVGFSSLAGTTANTAETIIASSANGALVQFLKSVFYMVASANTNGAFIAKTGAAPTAINDISGNGFVICTTETTAVNSGTNVTHFCAKQDRDFILPAGYTLYWICDTAYSGATGVQKSARYKLL